MMEPHMIAFIEQASAVVNYLITFLLLNSIMWVSFAKKLIFLIQKTQKNVRTEQ
jgi:hypothetical protein